MSSSSDPLFDAVRALPRAEVDPRLAEEVRQRALATLAGPQPRPRARDRLIAAAVAAGAAAYFGWAVAFVLASR